MWWGDDALIPRYLDRGRISPADLPGMELDWFAACWYLRAYGRDAVDVDEDLPEDESDAHSVSGCV